jgi:uncharacterized phage-like protein YoqJ
MQEGKRWEEEKQQQVKEKLRLVDEIKSRYRAGDHSARKSTDMREAVIERIDVTHAFESDESQRPARFKEKERTRKVESGRNVLAKEEAKHP